MTDEDLRKRLAEVLERQTLAVLATHGRGGPYCSLVGFTVWPDLTGLVFATGRATQKFRNIADEPRVAMMIDTRGLAGRDFAKAVAVTAVGEASELPAAVRQRCLGLHRDRHVALADLLQRPDCALLSVRVRKYVVVFGVHDVRELSP